MAQTSIVVITLMITQVLTAPQSPVTIKSPVNMSYQELEYLLQTRAGNAVVEPPKILSPCARAILGCCHNEVMNSHCSERLQCGAHFFDNNPCEERFVVQALKAAKNFYNQFESST